MRIARSLLGMGFAKHVMKDLADYNSRNNLIVFGSVSSNNTDFAEKTILVVASHDRSHANMRR